MSRRFGDENNLNRSIGGAVNWLPKDMFDISFQEAVGRFGTL
jgi:hypothetical protein